MLEEEANDEEVVIEEGADGDKFEDVVCILEVVDLVLLLVLLAVTAAEVVLEVLELVVIETGGKSNTPLEAELSKRVAVRVACVFDKAPTCPTHILYASSMTASLASAPVHSPIISSEVRHCTAPSAIVYPEVVL